METGRIKLKNRKDIIYKINENGCHEVISHANRGNGYHCIKIDGKVLDIHRWYYGLLNPDIDLTGLVVRHKCDNKRCINPHHLESGTYSDNMFDMIDRDKHSYKLNKNDVYKIKELALNNINLKELAKLFDVGLKTILNVLSGRTWSKYT